MRERAQPGFNFMTSGHAPEALLTDMEGRVLHRWRVVFDELRPESELAEDHPGRAFFRRALLLPEGELLVIFDGLGIAKVDRDSRTLWASSVKAHHDARVLPSGEIFYSNTCGTAERLPNANTLITESDNGRAFEVTPEGEIVWEFYNPHRAGEQNEFIATLFEVVRLPPDHPLDWLDLAARP